MSLTQPPSFPHCSCPFPLTVSHHHMIGSPSNFSIHAYTTSPRLLKCISPHDQTPHPNALCCRGIHFISFFGGEYPTSLVDKVGGDDPFQQLTHCLTCTYAPRPPQLCSTKSSVYCEHKCVVVGTLVYVDGQKCVEKFQGSHHKGEHLDRSPPLLVLPVIVYSCYVSAPVFNIK